MFGWQGELPFQEDPMLLTPQQPPMPSNTPLYDPPPGSINPSPMPLLGPKSTPAEVPRYGKPIGPENPTYSNPPQTRQPFVDIGPRVTPQEYFAGKVADVSRMPLGMRISNNPGNIKYSGSAWQRRNFPGLEGPSAARDQGDPQAQFANPLAGMVAAARLARLKYDQGMNTVGALIAGPRGWTPGYTGAAQHIASLMGVGVNDPVDLTNPAVKQKFLRALITQEHGPQYSGLYDDALISRGVEIANNGGAGSPITAQGNQPTSSSPAPAPSRGRGMLGDIKNMISGWGYPQAQPAAAYDPEAAIASLDRMGIAKDDPMRGAFETYARALAGGPAPPEPMSPVRRGVGTFLDVLGAGLGRRGGNTAAAPILPDMIAAQDKERQRLEERAYKAQLALLGSAMPYVQGEAKRVRDQNMMREALGLPPAPLTQSAPVAPGGAAGVQMPSAAARVAGNPSPASGSPAVPPQSAVPQQPMGTAPIMPVQRAELPAPTVPLNVQPTGGAPAAQGITQPGTPLPLSPPQQGMQPQPGGNTATSGAPAGPAGPGSKFRITPADVEARFPLPYTAQQITAMGLVNDKMADNMRQQNEAVVKQRDQFIKLYEVGRSTDDPQSAEEKAFATERGKAKAGIEAAKVDAARTAQGITNSIKALDEMITSDKFTEKAIGAWDASPWMGGTAFNRVLTMGNDVGSDEVRTFIEQRARGIAASMKPFVRKPGEGAWSDKDQEALENMVGDLTYARDATDLRRRIRNIHSFVNDTFAKPLGVEMPATGLPDVGGTSNPGRPAGPQQQGGVDVAARNAEIMRRYQAADPAGKAAIEQSLRSKGIDPASIFNAGPMQQEPYGPATPDDIGGEVAQRAALDEQARRLGWRGR